MVYHGRVEKGVVVLDEAATLPEGTRVRVEAEGDRNPAEAPRGSWEAIKEFAGIWADQSEEMERSLNELRAMKAEEVQRQQQSPEPEL